VRCRPVQHAIKLDTNALRRNLAAERFLHLRVITGVQKLGVKSKSETTREADGAQSAERVIEKGLAGRERGANDAVAEILHPELGEIFDRAGVEVVEERVDGEVTAEGVLGGSAEASEGNAGVLSVLFSAEVDEVDADAMEAHGGSLEVLALLRVGSNDADFGRGLVTGLMSVALFEMMSHLLSERLAAHAVNGEVDIGGVAVKTEQLVAHPPTGSAQGHGQLALAYDVKKGAKYSLLLLSAVDCSSH
jgi:hypothetical protein